MPVDMTGLPGAIRAKCDELSRDIDFNRRIDKGANGYVLIGHNRVSEQDIAIKFYYWGNGDHIEPALLARIDCEFTLRVLHAESLDADHAFFMTPFCAAGDLDEVMLQRKFGPVEAVDLLCQLAGGASFLHGSGYLHRDLKPSNIFAVEADRYVIGDFGSVVPLNAQGYAHSPTKHSLLYRPPEVVTTGCFYREGDIYQLGLILFQILGGRLPYDEAAWLSTAELQHYRGLLEPDRQFYATGIIEDRIERGRLVNTKTLPPWVPRSLASVVRKCCARDQQDRYALAGDLRARLNNLRGNLPDWKIAEHPVLYRGRRRYRVVPMGTCFRIEKSVGGGPWRQERNYAPATMKEAVGIAEGL